jgi:16S rRNA (guanine1207-N2)-methyltransferase
MSHYFSKNHDTIKSNPFEIAFRVQKQGFTFVSDEGVFSKSSLDRGTAVLLDIYQPSNRVKSALDLGCGYGTIGIVMHELYNIQFDMIDVNDRALHLAEENNRRYSTNNRVFYSEGFENVDSTYDLIISNPPIRIGKELLYKLFKDATTHLNEGGVFVVVMNKKHGALSTEQYLKTIYNQVDTIGRKKGFYVFQCKN